MIWGHWLGGRGEWSYSLETEALVGAIVTLSTESASTSGQAQMAILPLLAGMGEGKCSWYLVRLESTGACFLTGAGEQERFQHSPAGLLKSSSTGGWDTPLLPHWSW